MVEQDFHTFEGSLAVLAGEPVSSRQAQVIWYTLQGYTAKEIARALGLSFRTVEYYLKLLKCRFDCRSKRELIAKFIQALDGS